MRERNEELRVYIYLLALALAAVGRTPPNPRDTERKPTHHFPQFRRNGGAIIYD
jgi:hypothetical protein